MNDSSLLNSNAPESISQNPELKKQIEDQEKLISVLMTSGSFDFKSWMLSFSSFEKDHDRFLYSKISQMIIMESDDERILSLISRIATIVERIILDKSITRDRQIKDDDFDNDKVRLSKEKYKLIYKLYDHCNLANTQRDAYNQTRNSIKENVDASFEEKYKKEFDSKIKPEMESVQKEITSQLIGLVSMFTALSFIIFGGTQMLDSILDNIRLSTISRMICVGFLWTLCMSMLFYIFVWFIIKIMKPNETNIFTNKFKKLFWIYIGILMLILIVFTVLSFVCPKLFAII